MDGWEGSKYLKISGMVKSYGITDNCFSTTHLQNEREV